MATAVYGKCSVWSPIGMYRHATHCSSRLLLPARFWRNPKPKPLTPRRAGFSWTQMPTYEYVCEACQHEWEAFQSIKDDPLSTCPNCAEERAKRQISRSGGFILKGGGWYSDLYASSGGGGSSSGGSSSSSSDSSSASSDSSSSSTSSGSSTSGSSATSSGSSTSSASSTSGSSTSGSSTSGAGSD